MPAILLLPFVLAGGHTAWAGAPTLSFVDVTSAAGFNTTTPTPSEGNPWPAVGAAAGDYDKDGWIDLYVLPGDSRPSFLYHNLGNGTFEEVAAAAGVAISWENGTGPTFADMDGDGWIDLIFGSVGSVNVQLFRNLGNGTFQEMTSGSGVVTNRNTFSSAFGDYDLDGDLDLLQGHWEPDIPCTAPCTGHLWQNDSHAVFSNMDTAADVDYTTADHTFTPNFADLNNDRYPDLLFASDFNSSRVFLNDGDGTFTDVTDETVITDQNGMGAAVGDYDNDGDLDWFVTSVHNGTTLTGNRLYRNDGTGVFEDVSAAAGVRVGFFGWGACFADLDNDGNLDIFHVNGWFEPAYANDLSRIFMSNGDGTFTEKSADFGLVDTAQGRGVVCFDYDRDGDIDLFVANQGQPPALYRNDGGNANHFLNVHLVRPGGGRTVIGSRIYATIGAVTQMREVRDGSNFVSQNPEEVHFGLGSSTTVDELRVQWPDGTNDTYSNVAADQFLEVAPTRIFNDGFESGDLSSWSATAGAGP
jgi:hypothetical protein